MGSFLFVSWIWLPKHRKWSNTILHKKTTIRKLGIYTGTIVWGQIIITWGENSSIRCLPLSSLKKTKPYGGRFLRLCITLHLALYRKEWTLNVGVLMWICCKWLNFVFSIQDINTPFLINLTVLLTYLVSSIG